MAQTVIEQIKDRLPIAEVLAGYITLIPAGSAFKARCPFHNEKTPSFSVSPAQGFYYCFGCGEKGDIFSFVQKFEGLDFKGALKVLADRAGIALVYEKREASAGPDEYEFLDTITKKYEDSLEKNTAALAYLLKRGLSQETISAFRIGYVPDEWQFVAGSIEKSDTKVASDMGIIKEVSKDGVSRLYDRFRSRIMFPLCDSSGRVIAFSGRIFPNTDTGPKYLNSPETSLFHKSKVLYGFDKAKGAIKKHGFSILVEGQMDMVLSHQYGFRNTVATSGTAVSMESAKDPFSHLAIISRLSPNIILAFDGDEAGIKAQSRAALVVYSLGMNPKVLSLSEGIDPADFLVTQGADMWKELLKVSKSYIEAALARIPLASSPSAIPRLLQKEVFPALAQIRSEIERSTYIQIIAKELSLRESAVQSDFESFLLQLQKEEAVEEVIQKKKIPDTSLALLGLISFVQNPELDVIYAQVQNTSFEDIRIALPEYSDIDLEYARMYIEQEYGHLEMKDFILLAKEFSKKITHGFFESIKQTLSQALAAKERIGAHDEADAIVKKLHTLTSRQHETQ
jgi:DNA primase